MHAHFDCFSGISGDMVLGAFVDIGVSAQWLSQQIGHLGLDGVSIEVQNVKKKGIAAKKIIVRENLTAPARNYRDIMRLIDDSDLPETVCRTAGNILGRIADAEAHIHGCRKDDVHFHEVGAVDSIVDIVGAALCIDYLGIDSVSSSPLPLGSGFVTCAHGTLPVPAPATLEILKGIPVYGGQSRGEMVTPTGAAVIASLAGQFGSVPEMKIKMVGYGSGSRDDPEIPNLLRLIMGDIVDLKAGFREDDVCQVEANIDDMNPEIFGYLMEKLFTLGALDVSLLPLTMKKNRPGTKIEVLCDWNHKETIVRAFFAETSTIGVRYHHVHRHTLARSSAAVNTSLGEIRVKRIVAPDGRVSYAPEYEACKALALKKNIALKEVYHAANEGIWEGRIIQTLNPVGGKTTEAEAIDHGKHEHGDGGQDHDHARDL